LADCAAHEIDRLSASTALQCNTADEDALDDGFFLCDVHQVHRKAAIWQRLFPAVKPFFALKCHPDPVVAAVLAHAGAGFDCASAAELQLGLEASSNSAGHTTTGGAAAHNLIYANPQRAEAALGLAMAQGVRVLTFDGAEELHKVHAAYQQVLLVQQQRRTTDAHRASSAMEDNVDDDGSIPQMVLRILVPDEHSAIPLGEKFGAPPDQWASLVTLAMSLHLPVVGVSFHCGSGNHDPASYTHAIALAQEALALITELAVAAALPPPWLLDIGGGFPGVDGCGGDEGRFRFRTPDNDKVVSASAVEGEADHSTAAIAAVVTPLLAQRCADARLPPLHCVAEPGRYFVEASFALCSRIYMRRKDEEDDRVHYYIAQGVQGVFKDALLCNEVFVPQALRLASAPDSKDDNETTTTYPCTIHGPSGEDYDIVCPDVRLPQLEIGDWLLFDRMGAYTMSIASRRDRPSVRYVL
jgi:ornithine decarboxylase